MNSSDPLQMSFSQKSKENWQKETISLCHVIHYESLSLSLSHRYATFSFSLSISYFSNPFSDFRLKKISYPVFVLNFLFLFFVSFLRTLYFRILLELHLIIYLFVFYFYFLSFFHCISPTIFFVYISISISLHKEF